MVSGRGGEGRSRAGVLFRLLVVVAGVVMLTTPGRPVRAEGPAAASSPPAAVSVNVRPTKPIKVMTQNVCAEKCPELAPWSTRSTRVAAEVAKEAPQVFVAQETTQSARLRTLSTKLKAEGYQHVAGAGGRNVWVRSSQVTTVKTGVMKVQATGGGDCYNPVTGAAKTLKTGKVQYVPWVLAARAGSDSTYLVVDVHLSAADCKVTERHRVSEIKQIVKRAGARADAAGATLVMAGDYNSYASGSASKSIDSDSYRYGVFAALRRAGYDSAVLTSTSLAGHPATAHSYMRMPGDHRNLGVNRQFDHIVTSLDSTVTSYRLGAWAKTSQRASDHRYVTATVEAIP